MAETLLTALAVFLRIIANPAENVFQKQLTVRGTHPLLVNFLTYALLSCVCFAMAFNTKWDGLPTQFWMYSVLGGMAGALGNGFLVRALQRGDLSVLGPINSYKSVIGVLFGIFLLGEIPNRWGILGITLIICGSYFVLDTTPEKFPGKLLQKPEIQYRLWAMVLTAIEAVFVKKIILASSTLLAFMSWCFFGAAFSLLLLFVYRLDIRKEVARVERRDFGTYLYLLVCMGTMQLTTNYAFAHMAVGYALSLFQLSTLVSVLLGYRIFQEGDMRKKLAGSILMIAGSVVIILL
ncbi:EamA family transporter [Salmonirosea aquatica]|uniref:EamA family transporter n=1 Tax=Salmonirosea aquatica TaxID=2654236 RepID=A0A7C9F2A9_9BACT|nr:EamA family transporter [Cytophagaceae bacterium SJW1-29]